MVKYPADLQVVYEWDLESPEPDVDEMEWSNPSPAEPVGEDEVPF